MIGITKSVENTVLLGKITNHKTLSIHLSILASNYQLYRNCYILSYDTHHAEPLQQRNECSVKSGLPGNDGPVHRSSFTHASFLLCSQGQVSNNKSIHLTLLASQSHCASEFVANGSEPETATMRLRSGKRRRPRKTISKSYQTTASTASA